MTKITDDKVRELNELSKNDNAIIVGSEVRQLCQSLLASREEVKELELRNKMLNSSVDACGELSTRVEEWKQNYEEADKTRYELHKLLFSIGNYLDNCTGENYIEKDSELHKRIHKALTPKEEV